MFSSSASWAGLVLRTSVAILTASILSSSPVLAEGNPDLGTVLASNDQLSTYYKLVKEYPDILLQLPNYAGVTIVAPNNEAFTKLPNWDPTNQTLVTNLLEYHMLQGTVATAAVPIGPARFVPTLLTNTSWANVTGGQNMIVNHQDANTIVFTSGEGSRTTVLEFDIVFSGGLIQVVDSLLVPPARLEPTARDAYADMRAFLGALYDAELVPTFADAQDVTIFAPHNAAFQLVSGTLSALSKDELTDILKYHVVPGTVLSSEHLTNGTNLTTAGGDLLHITRSGNNAYVDRAQLVQPDILIANGVVHMIDGVLNPAAADALPDPAIGTQSPVFAISGTPLTGTSAPTPFTSFLPCTQDCPVTTSDSVTGARTTSLRSSSSHGGGSGPRCTGLPYVAGVGAGLLGLGLGVAGVV